MSTSKNLKRLHDLFRFKWQFSVKSSHIFGSSLTCIILFSICQRRVMSIAPDRYCPYITRKQKTQKDKQFKISKHKGYTKMIKNCPHLSISNNSNRCPFCITEINACGQMWSSGITQITTILHISKILQTSLNFSYQISIFFIIFNTKILYSRNWKI